MKIFTFIVSIVCMNFVVLSGTVGNILTFVVLQKDKQRRATHFILSSLSIFDTLFLITSYCFQSVPTFISERNQPTTHRIFALCGPFIYMLGHATRMMRNWTVVLVSLERFIAACYPLRAKTHCTRRNARIAIIIIVLLCILYSCPRVFEMRISEGPLSFEGQFWSQMDDFIKNMTNTSSNKHQIIFTRVSIESSELARSPIYHFLYKYAGYCIFVIGAPVVLLTILNTCVIVSVKRSHNKLKVIRDIAAKVYVVTEVVQNSDGNTIYNEKPNNPLNSNISQMSIDVLSSSSARNSVRSQSIAMSRTSSNTSRKRRVVRNKSARELRSEQTANELTRVCIVILFCYTVCELPPLVYQIVSPLEFDVLNSYLQPLSVLFATLNSSELLCLNVLHSTIYMYGLRSMSTSTCATGFGMSTRHPFDALNA